MKPAVSWLACATVWGATACGGPSVPSPAPAAAFTSAPASTPEPAVAVTAAPAPPAAPASAPAADDIARRVHPDLVACYERGRAEIPTMTSGKITLHTAVDASGVTRCVVPSDDTGLTQAVEDCMRERLARERYAPSAARWSRAVPVVVSKGVVSEGSASSPPLIETIESHGLGEDVYDVVESLLPALKDCVASPGASTVVYIGAKVAPSGKVECALASSRDPLPETVSACVEGVLARARFKPPKRGLGLLAVPLQILRSGR